MTIFNRESTIKDVRDWIQANEAQVWDEYIHVFGFTEGLSDAKLYSFLESEGYLEVVVRLGTNEGIYCIVKMDYGIVKRPSILIFCKTLDDSRANLQRCFESAGRIYNALTGG